MSEYVGFQTGAVSPLQGGKVNRHPRLQRLSLLKECGRDFLTDTVDVHHDRVHVTL